jgi:O-antigen ligase
VATAPRQLPVIDISRHKLFLISLFVLIVIAVAVLIQLNAPGESETIYYVTSAAIVLASFAFLLQPLVCLSLILLYLISPAPLILDVNISAAITSLLAVNCFFATLLASGFNSPFPRRSLKVLFLLCAIAGAGALWGAAQGNRLSLVLGDFYQVVEFAALFFLAQTLVKTEQQFRTLAYFLIASTIGTSVLQMADALLGAHYLPHLNQQGVDVARTINLNAPIALVVLLATLATTKSKKWAIAGIGIAAINLIWSFTRGLWVAAAASVIFLVIIQRGAVRRMVLKFALVTCLVSAPLIYLSGLGSVIADRISYSLVQIDNASPEEQVLSGRRLLEYLLILPSVAEHPLAGKGLGATFEIAGDAVLEGPKGEQVDHHYIHNLYLLVAFRLGVPALLALLVILWKYFRRSIRNLRSPNFSPAGTALLAGLIAAMFGEVVLSLTSPTFLNHPTAGVLGCIMAITTNAFHREPASLPQP